MNTPNKLTLLRVFLIPVYVVLMLVVFKNHYYYAGAVFIIASLTDLVDGYIARKNNLVTDFGKFADPLADKLLVMSAMVIFVQMNMIKSYIVIIILAREFAVTALRTMAAKNGVVMAADKIGKWKTTVQMIALVLMHFFELSPNLYTAANVLIYVAAVLTIVSGVNYFVLNKDCISMD